MTLRLLFIHGLEGSPTGFKSVYLKDRYSAPPNAYSCPAMPHVDLGPQLESCFKACVETQRAAIKEFKPTLVVASSFGAAVAVELILDGTWAGPTLLLACAHKLIGKMVEKEGGRTFELPKLPAVPILILHGRQDVVVPIDDSRELYANAADKESVKLVEVDDSHGLRKQVQEDLLKNFVDELWNSTGGKTSEKM
jgi:hypothetical protein